MLTHAQLSPPDGLNYDDFFAKRSEALRKCIRLGARIKKQEFQVLKFHSICLFLFSEENRYFCEDRKLSDGRQQCAISHLTWSLL